MAELNLTWEDKLRRTQAIQKERWVSYYCTFYNYTPRIMNLMLASRSYLELS